MMFVCNFFALQTMGSVTAESTQQQITVNGTVTDKEGEPLPGVNITMKGTSTGIATDENGRYSIKVANRDDILVFSYIGFMTTELRVGSNTELNVVLEEDAMIVDEVIVVGYGTQKKSNLTGAISVTDSKVLENRPITNLGQGLQGVISNLNITQSSGIPGAESNFNIRGVTSLSGGSPLILVDGIEMNPNILNPSDIKSISVLKDAPSSAVYGARAAFGVVLITTKTGYVTRKPVVSAEISYTIDKPTVHPNAMNSVEYADWMNAAQQTTVGRDYFDAFEMQAIRNFYNNPKNSPPVVLNPNTGLYQYCANTDWYSTLNKDTYPMSNYGINITGGSRDVKYYASAGYFNQKGISKFNDENYDRFNVMQNLMYKVNNWLEAGLQTVINISDNKTGGLNNSGTNAVLNILANDSRPIMPLYHPDGNFAGDTGGDNGYFTNLAAWQSLGGNSRTKMNDMLLTGRVIIKPFKGFTITSDYTYRYTNTGFKNYRRSYLDYNPAGASRWFPHTSPNSVSYNEYDDRRQTFNLYGEYEKKFADKHDFKLMVGFNQELFVNKSISVGRSNLISNDIPYLSLASGDRTSGDSEIELAIRGVFYRLNYGFKDKYLLTLAGRYDGSSRFPTNDRFAFFPSFSAGWRIAKENFWSGISHIVNDLKIRGSYGYLGNQVTTGNYPYILNYGSGEVNYLFAGKKEMTVTAPALVSSTLTWETVEDFGIGVDAAFINNKLQTTFGWYSRTTKDMLMAGKMLPAVLAVSEPTENAADLRTTGWEWDVSWKDQLDNGLIYGISFSLWDNTTEIIKFDNPTNSLSTRYVGQKINEIWGFVTEGLFKSDEEAANWNQSAIQNISPYRAGDIKFADLDGKPGITRGANTVDDPGDQKIIGNSTARYQFNFGMNGEWKGFDARIFFQGVGKREIYPSNILFLNHYTGQWAVPQKMNTDYWREDNPDAYFPRPRFNAGNSVNQAQTRFLQNASYVRLKQLTVGYTIPFKYTDKIGFSKCRIYFSANNLWEIHGMKKTFDPELAQVNAYPFFRSYSFGANVTF